MLANEAVHATIIVLEIIACNKSAEVIDGIFHFQRLYGAHKCIFIGKILTEECKKQVAALG